MDLNDKLDQVLAASLVNAIYIRMLLYRDALPENALAEASREVMTLWRSVVHAIQRSQQPPAQNDQDAAPG